MKTLFCEACGAVIANPDPEEYYDDTQLCESCLDDTVLFGYYEPLDFNYDPKTVYEKEDEDEEAA